MKLKLLRTKLLDKWTNGQLYIDDEFFCFTLEDKVREPKEVPEGGWTDDTVAKWKIQDQTAIPRGLYSVELQNSPKFGADTPTLLKVPGFKYIRMHSGNTDKDTEGCIILGYRLTDSGLIAYGSTRPAVSDLRKNLKLAKSPITIQVV